MISDGKPCSILIVEDEPIVAKDLQQTLCEMHYDAFAIASSAEEAIRRASEKCPDLVLMDIRIKGERDGIETAQILHDQFGVSVIYLTAHADEATIQRATRTAPYGYLLKPIKSAELRGAIEIAAFKQKLDKCARERERRLSVALNSVSDAVVTVDLAGKITYLNPAAESLVGAKSESAIGKSAEQILQLMNQSASSIDATPLDAALRLKHPIEPENASLRNAATGVAHTIDESAGPIVEGGHLLGAVMVFRDVGEKKRMQQQLELADRLSSLGTMAAGTAHELNNPLTVVVTNCGFLAEELEELRSGLRATSMRDPTSKTFTRIFEALGDVQAAASRMSRIVADLRSFSRPAESESNDVDLRRCIEWAVRATAHEFHHRAQLHTRLEPAPRIFGESARIEQVLVNLLVNAAQAIAPGKAEQNEVWVNLHGDEQGRAVIEVRDTGNGMRPEVVNRIFDPFFTTKKAGAGTGLGLSICHGIVKSMGETSRLPVSSESALPSGCYSPPAPQGNDAASTTAARLEPAALRGRILLIDDEIALLRAMHRILEDEDHHVTTTQSARDALAMIDRGEKFELILCDLMMPTMTGVDFYETLLTRRPDLAKSVIFITGGAVTAKVGAFLQSVPNIRLEKPFKGAQLREAVQRGLARSDGVHARS